LLDFRAQGGHLDDCRSLSRKLSIFRLALRADLKKPDFQTSIPPPRAVPGGQLKTEAEMATGTVKWFNTTKGYGFIQPEDGGKDVFVHISAVERAGLRGLNEGQRVSYELERDKRSGKESAGNLQSL